MKPDKSVREAAKKAASELKKAQRILITGHVSPDGDSVGSCLALSLALKSMGKETVVYFEDPLPYNFAFLPGAGEIIKKVPETSVFDHSVILDVNEKERVGKGFPWNRAGFIINIDHHVTGPGIGEILVHDETASATGEILHNVFTPEIATNIYCAIITDTGSFHYSNSTPESFMIGGEMVSAGAEPWFMASHIYESEPPERISLLGLALQTLRFSCNGRLADLTVTLKMYEATGATSDMTDQFVNFARSIRGVQVAAMLRELKDGSFKVSIRSRESTDVSRVGLQFGGGGHKNAAGFNLPGPISKARELLENAVTKELEKNHS